MVLSTDNTVITQSTSEGSKGDLDYHTEKWIRFVLFIEMVYQDNNIIKFLFKENLCQWCGE